MVFVCTLCMPKTFFWRILHLLPLSRAQYVLGYTVANDVTARRWQGKKGGGQWVRSKGFDTFLPLGPALALAHTIPNPNNLLLESRLNDVVMQRANTSEMIFSVPELISFLSQGVCPSPPLPLTRPVTTSKCSCCWQTARTRT